MLGEGNMGQEGLFRIGENANQFTIQVDTARKSTLAILRMEIPKIHTVNITPVKKIQDSSKSQKTKTTTQQ